MFLLAADLCAPYDRQIAMSLDHPGQLTPEEPVLRVRDVVCSAEAMLHRQVVAGNQGRQSNGACRLQNDMLKAYSRLCNQSLVMPKGCGRFQLKVPGAARVGPVRAGMGLPQHVWEIGFEPDSASLTRAITGGVGVPDYRRVHLNRRVYAELLHNGNRGLAALGIFLEYPQEGRTLEHPGQVVSGARGHLTGAGLRRSSWRKLAAMPGPLVTEVCHTAAAAALSYPAMARQERMDGALAMFINSLGDRDPPSREYTGAAMRLYWSTAPGVLTGERNRDRLQLMMTLLLADEERGGGASAEEPFDVDCIRTYVLQCRSRPESRTWGGLVRASDRWWEEEVARDEQEQFLRQAKHRGGCGHWDSLVSRATIGPYTYEALTSEYDLLMEGQRQRHCVFDYATDCTDHRIRIFSVFKGGKRASESHGRRNAIVEPGLLEASETLAEAYQRAWLEEGAHGVHAARVAPAAPVSWDTTRRMA